LDKLETDTDDKKVHPPEKEPKVVNCKGLTFEECEDAILHLQMKEAKKKIGKRTIKSVVVQKMITIVEMFLKQEKLIVYGGTAINNLLPENEQFYDRTVDLADYDFFTTEGVTDAKKLADLYLANGFKEVEAKAAQHYATFKVFVNFIPIADVSTISNQVFNLLKKNSIEKDGIFYAAPNFLRMAMYTELSRPAGNTDRWEKVVKRLKLFNKYHPITAIDCEKQFRTEQEETKTKETSDSNKSETSKTSESDKSDSDKEDSSDSDKEDSETSKTSDSDKSDSDSETSKTSDSETSDKSNKSDSETSEESHQATTNKGKKQMQLIFDILHSYNVVFFGSFAFEQYAKYMSRTQAKILRSMTGFVFDVISNRANQMSEQIVKKFVNAKRIHHEAIGDLIPECFEVQINEVPICFIYQSIACHSYNILTIQHKKVKLASIFTILSFYLAFLYVDKEIYYKLSEKMLCVADFLYQLQQKHLSSQKGILKAYSITCYGHQPSQQDMRKEKAKMRKKIKPGSPHYEDWFLNYRPAKQQKQTQVKKEKHASSKSASASFASSFAHGKKKWNKKVTKNSKDSKDWKRTKKEKNGKRKKGDQEKRQENRQENRQEKHQENRQTRKTRPKKATRKKKYVFPNPYGGPKKDTKRKHHRTPKKWFWGN
jgi:hypothetical protein